MGICCETRQVEQCARWNMCRPEWNMCRANFRRYGITSKRGRLGKGQSAQQTEWRSSLQLHLRETNKARGRNEARWRRFSKRRTNRAFFQQHFMENKRMSTEQGRGLDCLRKSTRGLNSLPQDLPALQTPVCMQSDQNSLCHD